jgi:competence protein ComEC
VAKEAGVSKIDYLLITHYHGDHVGGVLELAKRLPIDTFIVSATENRKRSNTLFGESQNLNG